MHKIKKIIAKNIYNVFAIKSYSSDTRKNEKSHWNLKVAANQEPVCLSSGSSSAPRFRTGEARATPNGDFGGAAPRHLQEEPKLFLYYFGGATNSSSVAPAPASAPRAELSVMSPNKWGLSIKINFSLCLVIQLQLQLALPNIINLFLSLAILLSVHN